jgi:hypothetical protein
MGNKAGALDRNPEQLRLAADDTRGSAILATFAREEMTRRDPQGGSGNEAEGRQASNPHSDDPPNVRNSAAHDAALSLPPALQLMGKAAEMR